MNVSFYETNIKLYEKVLHSFEEAIIVITHMFQVRDKNSRLTCSMLLGLNVSKVGKKDAGTISTDFILVSLLILNTFSTTSNSSSVFNSTSEYVIACWKLCAYLTADTNIQLITCSKWEI